MAKSKYIEALEEQYTKKDAKSVLRYKAPDNKWRYVQTSKDASGGNMPSGGGMTEVTWQELKDKRDNGELNPGSLYRITDYNCTTTQENTQSAGHQFDIVLLALSEDKLAEEGWAMMHENVYDVTFDDGVTKKCHAYIVDEYNHLNVVSIETLLGIEGLDESEYSINENNKNIIISGWESGELNNEDVPYNYFQNSNLSAWKVWYCLDNDRSRFAWADDRYSFAYGSRVYNRAIEKDIEESNTKYFAYDGVSQEDFNDIITVFFTSEVPKEGDIMYRKFGSLAPIGSIEVSIDVKINGRGVIYRLVDEWNNDCPYDFKNIQYKTKLDSDGFYNISGDDSWTYSLNCYDVDNSICYDTSIICATLVVSDMTLDCYDNFISCAIGNGKFALQHNQIFTNYSFDDEITNSAYCIKMFGSTNARIGFSSNVGVYGCSSFDMEYKSNAIYINNKKVLTES